MARRMEQTQAAVNRFNDDKDVLGNDNTRSDRSLSKKEIRQDKRRKRRKKRKGEEEVESKYKGSGVVFSGFGLEPGPITIEDESEME